MGIHQDNRAALTEDLGSVPRKPMVAHNHLLTISRELNALSLTSMGTGTVFLHRTNTYIGKTFKHIKLNQSTNKQINKRDTMEQMPKPPSSGKWRKKGTGSIPTARVLICCSLRVTVCERQRKRWGGKEEGYLTRFEGARRTAGSETCLPLLWIEYAQHLRSQGEQEVVGL